MNRFPDTHKLNWKVSTIIYIHSLLIKKEICHRRNNKLPCVCVFFCPEISSFFRYEFPNFCVICTSLSMQSFFNNEGSRGLQLNYNTPHAQRVKSYMFITLNPQLYHYYLQMSTLGWKHNLTITPLPPVNDSLATYGLVSVRPLEIAR